MSALGRSRVRAVVLFLIAVFILWIWLRPFARPVAQIYFPEQNQLFVVPVSRAVSGLSPQVLARELEKGPGGAKLLLPAVPPEVIPSKVTVSGGEIEVEFPRMPSLEKWPLLLDCYMSTFKQLNGFDSVSFHVRGETDGISNGVEFGKESLAGYWINDNSGVSQSAYPDIEHRGKAVIYYLLSGTSYLVPLTVRVQSDLPIEQAVALALSDRAPLSWAFQSALPPGSRVIAVNRPIPDRIEVTMAWGGLGSRKLAEKALALTFTDISGVRYVQIRGGTRWTGWRPAQKRPRYINEARGPS